MYKTLLSIAIVAFAPHCLFAQDFPGIRTSNFSGSVSSAFYNPAGLADSRHVFDFNLLGISTQVINSEASFKFSDFASSFHKDSLVNKVLTSGSGVSNAFASLAVQGPSLMLSLGRKSGIAFTTRVRLLTKATNAEVNLYKGIWDESSSSNFPQTINSANNNIVNVNAFSDYGFSFAHLVFENKNHMIKAGITGRYFNGLSNISLQLNQINGTINEDARGSYLTNTTGSISMQTGGIDFTATDKAAFKDYITTGNFGFGGDVGLIYEWRPNYTGSEEDSLRLRDRETNKYTLKVAASLTDVGSIKYASLPYALGSYNVHIPSSGRFYLNSISRLETIKDTLHKYPAYFTPQGSNESSYKVKLPSTIHLMIDYRLYKGFYLNVGADLPLTSAADHEAGAASYLRTVSVTPRFEGRAFGVYVPVTLNEYAGLAAGAALRLGPLYVGSGSILSLLTNKSKQVDAFVGLRFGGLHNKQKKQAKPKKSEETVEGAFGD